jgi:hypothetical protein
MTGGNTASSACAAGLKHEEVSTYEAYIVGREDVLSLLSPTVYKVKVAGPNGIHFVWHRYSDFDELHRRLRLRMPSLPRMPERGFLSKIEDGFLDRRQARLSRILQAMVKQDPQVEDPWLRSFLRTGETQVFKKQVKTEDVEEEVWDIGELSENEDLGEHEMTPSWPSDCDLKCNSFPVQSSCAADWSLEDGFSPGGASSVLISPRMKEDCTRRRSSSQEFFTKKVGKRGCHSGSIASPCSSPKAVDSPDVRERHVIIARDVARAFSGEARVDKIRLRVVEVLRGYARKDPEIGYVQGMCFGAVVTCLGSKDLAGAQQQFGALMCHLRELWLPGFPMVTLGPSLMKAVLVKRDPELIKHLDDLSLELSMIVPGAWISMFAKWFSLDVLVDLVPFLVSEGFAGFLAVTYVALLHHRETILSFQSIDEALPYIQRSFSQDPPENLLDMCRMSLPMMSLEINRNTRAPCSSLRPLQCTAPVPLQTAIASH